MIKLLRYISLSLIFFGVSASAYAIEAPKNLQVVSSSESQVDLAWDTVDGAAAYLVYYSLTEPVDNGYDKQWPDFIIDQSTVSLTGLSENQTHYFAVVSVDDEATESLFSNEVVATTSVQAEPEMELNAASEEEVIEDVVVGDVSETTEIISDEAFALKKVEAVELNKIAVMFNAPLDATETAQREFKIVNKSDKFDVLFVESTELDENDASKLVLTLDVDAELNAEYILTVTSISDATGRTIESGIDSVETFTMLESDIEKNKIVEPVEPVIIPEPTVIPDPVEPVEPIVNTGGLAGADVQAWDIVKDLNSAAAHNEKLPDTGPAHIFIAFLAIILGTLVFRFKQS